MFKLLALPFKALRGAVRFAGVRNSLLILLGVGVGCLVAPASGSQTRARLKRRIASTRAGGTDAIPADSDLTL